jgi:hypothetical protein
VLCDESPGSIQGDKSPNFEKFRALLVKGTSASLEEFLILWYPAKKEEPAPNTTLFSCEEKNEDP